MWGHSEKVVIWKPGRALSPETNPGGPWSGTSSLHNCEKISFLFIILPKILYRLADLGQVLLALPPIIQLKSAITTQRRFHRPSLFPIKHPGSILKIRVEIQTVSFHNCKPKRTKKSQKWQCSLYEEMTLLTTLATCFRGVFSIAVMTGHRFTHNLSPSPTCDQQHRPGISHIE